VDREKSAKGFMKFSGKKSTLVKVLGTESPVHLNLMKRKGAQLDRRRTGEREWRT
jgi:hypothetical protein